MVANISDEKWSIIVVAETGEGIWLLNIVVKTSDKNRSLKVAPHVGYGYGNRSFGSPLGISLFLLLRGPSKSMIWG